MTYCFTLHRLQNLMVGRKTNNQNKQQASSLVERLNQTSPVKEGPGRVRFPLESKTFPICSMDVMIKAPMTLITFNRLPKSDGLT